MPNLLPNWIHKLRKVGIALPLLILCMPVFAHEGGGIVGGFKSGFMHPLLGPDHILAMVAVGIWGAFLGRPA